MIECRDSTTEASTTTAASTTIEDNPNWRRHKGACVNYRERWSVGTEIGDEGCRLLYQIVCLMGTPPETAQEQIQCMAATRGCWRLKAGHPEGTSDHDASSASGSVSGGRSSRKGSRYASIS